MQKTYSAVKFFIFKGCDQALYNCNETVCNFWKFYWQRIYDELAFIVLE